MANPKNVLGEVEAWHHCRKLFTEQKNVWLRVVTRVNETTMRFHLSRHDQPGLIWTTDIDEVVVQRAIIGDPARQAFLLALCKAATKNRPVQSKMKLLQGA